MPIVAYTANDNKSYNCGIIRIRLILILMFNVF